MTSYCKVVCKRTCSEEDMQPLASIRSFVSSFTEIIGQIPRLVGLGDHNEQTVHDWRCASQLTSDITRLVKLIQPADAELARRIQVVADGVTGRHERDLHDPVCSLSRLFRTSTLVIDQATRARVGAFFIKYRRYVTHPDENYLLTQKPQRWVPKFALNCQSATLQEMSSDRTNCDIPIDALRNIPPVHASAFHKCLQRQTTAGLLTLKNVDDILHLSQSFQLEWLETSCVRFISRHFTMTSVLKYLEMGSIRPIPSLCVHAIAYLLANPIPEDIKEQALAIAKRFSYGMFTILRDPKSSAWVMNNLIHFLGYDVKDTGTQKEILIYIRDRVDAQAAWIESFFRSGPAIAPLPFHLSIHEPHYREHCLRTFVCSLLEKYPIVSLALDTRSFELAHYSASFEKSARFHRLNLRKIGKLDVQEMLLAVQHKKITSLFLPFLRLECQQAKQLARAIEANTNLEGLFLETIVTNAEGHCAIFEALGKSRRLRQLEIRLPSTVYIHEVYESFYKMLTATHSLEELTLYSTDDTNFFPVLASALSENSSLTSIDFQSQNKHTLHVQHLTACTDSTSLEKINISSISRYHLSQLLAFRKLHPQKQVTYTVGKNPLPSSLELSWRLFELYTSAVLHASKYTSDPLFYMSLSATVAFRGCIMAANSFVKHGHITTQQLALFNAVELPLSMLSSYLVTRYAHNSLPITEKIVRNLQQTRLPLEFKEQLGWMSLSRLISTVGGIAATYLFAQPLSLTGLGWLSYLQLFPSLLALAHEPLKQTSNSHVAIADEKNRGMIII